MGYSNELIKDVLAHCDIVKIISSYLEVKKCGRNYTAVCPFHDDTKPSLFISPEKQIYNCFVCHNKGNAITFVMNYEHLPFDGALRKIAELSGYSNPELQKNTGPVKILDEKKERILNCLKDLCLLYQCNLNTNDGNTALQYLEKRGLNADYRKKYKIGYSNSDGKAAISFLTKKGHSITTIEEAGIVSESGNVQLDLYRGRVTFAICDHDGNVVGFSGRKFLENDDRAKYYNTTNTYVFNKSSILYNYHIAKEVARNKGYIYVLEGFMDVFALSKIGIDSCVATMGTALTNEHVALLRKLNVEVRLCLDGDKPGQNATMVAAKLLNKSGINFSIVDAANNQKDSDEILNEDGEGALKSYLERTISFADFALNYYININPLKTIEAKESLIKEFFPILAETKSELEKDTRIRKLAEITGFAYQTIKNYFLTYLSKYNKNEEKNLIDVPITMFSSNDKNFRKLEKAERTFLYYMCKVKEAVDFYEKNKCTFYTKIFRLVADYLIEYASKNETISCNELIASLEGSDLENKKELVDTVVNLTLTKNVSPYNEVVLENLIQTMNEEKIKLYDEQMYQECSKGDDELAKARYLENSVKNKKNI